MTYRHVITLVTIVGMAVVVSLRAQSPVPSSITYQGRVSVNGVAFTGSGSFKFALVKQTAPPPTATYESLWSNDGTSVNGSEPTAAVEGIAIQGGQYSVALGDTSLSGMSLALSATVLASHEGLKLRVWFNDGTNGFQQLSPDVGLGAVPYAQVAARVPDGTITGAMVARETLTGENLSDGSVTATQLADGTITGGKIAGATITATQIASGTIGADKLTAAAADALSSSLVQTAPVPTFTAMEEIAALDAVAVTRDASNTARIIKANSTVGSRSGFYGFAKAAAAAGSPVTVHQYGPLAGFSGRGGLTAASSYFVAAVNGDITTANTGTQIYAGYAMSSDVLFVDPIGTTKRWAYSNYWGDGSDGVLSTEGNVSFPSTQDGEVVVKQFTSLTINEGHTVTTSQRCRGLVIYVDGNCTIHGTLTMTARGANVDPALPNSIPSTGIRLVRRKAGAIETLAASDLGGGGAGGVGATWRSVEAFQTGITSNGKVYVITREGGATGATIGVYNNGSDGQSLENGTGGGGTSSGSSGRVGHFGAAGTCYSGGSGGGGPSSGGGILNSTSGSPNGGAGGRGSDADGTNYGGGGGAGNPGGAAGSGGAGSGYPGQSGTGGLLILIVRGNLVVGPVGKISANGMNGGQGWQPHAGSGGGSGGGRVIVLHAGVLTQSGVVQANGGLGAAASNYSGKNGGNGWVTIDQIDP